MTIIIILAAIAAIVITASIINKAKGEPIPAHDPKEQQRAEIEAQLDALQAKLAEVENTAALLDEEDARTEKDAYERPPAFFDRDAGLALSVDMQLDYQDSNGLKTSRRITTESYQYTATEGMIYAHCQLRNSGRNFVFSRIQRAIDPSTGEVIDDLRAWLDAHYAVTPAAALDKLREAHWDALNCLHYVAKADGAFRAKERDLVRDFLARHAPDAGPATLDALIEEIKTWHAQSAIEFGKHLRKLIATPLAYRQDVVGIAEAMIASDKTAHSNEERAIKRLRKELLGCCKPAGYPGRIV